MKALCWHGKADIRWDSDAIIRVTNCGICGSDLHLHDGQCLACMTVSCLAWNPATSWGHEFMGEVVEVGTENKKLKSATA